MFKIAMFGKSFCVTLNRKTVFSSTSQSAVSQVARFLADNEITSAKAFAEHKDSHRIVSQFGSVPSF
jgi:hypothetical protein